MKERKRHIFLSHQWGSNQLPPACEAVREKDQPPILQPFIFAHHRHDGVNRTVIEVTYRPNIPDHSPPPANDQKVITTTWIQLPTPSLNFSLLYTTLSSVLKFFILAHPIITGSDRPPNKSRSNPSRSVTCLVIFLFLYVSLLIIL